MEHLKAIYLNSFQTFLVELIKSSLVLIPIPFMIGILNSFLISKHRSGVSLP